MTPSVRGRLLVAAPSLQDPNFDRTVVLVLEHTDDGALGVVLNRPSEIDVSAALPGWGLLAAAPPVVFLGGPVAPTGAICLGRSSAAGGGDGDGRSEGDGWQPLFAGLGTVDLDHSPGDVAEVVVDVRVFVGHAGWGGGQLEAEIEVGAWFVLDARPDDVVSPRAVDLWERVLRRQGGALARVANFPPDPSMN
ncbi:MAG: YqgE/AlgH family protein [Acidimicrobiia bacterium]|nr:YqgE/AlgH family protein [Acidimicrobiia bacterium]